MTIEEAHYNFKLQLNRLDSNNNRDLTVPEIDVLLNRAVGVFVKRIAEPREKALDGFEDTYRNLEDIRNLVVSGSLTKADSNTFELPSDMMFLIDQDIMAEVSNTSCNGSCIAVLRKHGDDFLTNVYKKSSIAWEILNLTLDATGLRTHQNNGDTVDSVTATYIKKPVFCHYASGYVGGTYTSLAGVVLTGEQDIDLGEHTHDEVINIAVTLAKAMLNHTANDK